ncbi:glycosyltransferase family 2 protein [candidate division KSB1 bacterium]|nr:glycosyltransferase family 2 protein [candidate division KSB1 bacterium]
MSNIEKMSYVVITPAKDEANYIEYTIKSMIRQTLLPKIWVIVDDDSQDNTMKIVQNFSCNNDWIKIISRKNKSGYFLGRGVVEAFNYGLEYVNQNNIHYNFLVKMDADLSFNQEFFETIIQKFNNNNEIGIISGILYEVNKLGKKKWEISPEYHTSGACKVYKSECFNEINGITPVIGWDALDNIKAIDKGWLTVAYRDIHFQHLRPKGGKYSLAKGRFYHGVSAYKIGSDIVYFFLRCIFSLTKKPKIIGSFYLFSGYLYALITNERQIVTQKQKRLFRKLQWNSILDRLTYKINTM